MGWEVRPYNASETLNPEAAHEQKTCNTSIARFQRQKALTPCSLTVFDPLKTKPLNPKL